MDSKDIYQAILYHLLQFKDQFCSSVCEDHDLDFNSQELY